jgi:cytochrome c
MQLVFSPDGRWLAGAATNRVILVWDLVRGAPPLTLRGHADLIMALVFSPDGATLASASYDKTIRLWRTGSWRSRVLRGHTASVDALSFTTDGHGLVSAGRDGTLRVWDLGEELDTSADGLRRRMAAMTTAAIDPRGRASTPAVAGP